MSFLGHPARDDVTAARAARTPHETHEIDLAAGEWEEVETAPPAEERLGVCTILSFWALAAVLLLVIVAAPALQAAAHRLPLHALH